MNYRHIYHAGNFADVLKHTVLVAVLLHLRKKEKPFAVFDSHGGAGLYDLSDPAARRTAEAAKGIITVLEQGALPSPLAEYCEVVRRFGANRYPGSPLIVAKLLRPQDRLVAVELHPEEYLSLRKSMQKNPRVRVIHGDGYKELKSLLPPPERRGVVLIDPPYESEDEYSTSVRAIADFYRRFSTGIYLLWYPIKSRAHTESIAGELSSANIADLLRFELDVDAPIRKRHPEQGPPLSAMGMLIVNAPFGLEAQMNSVLPQLVAYLGQGPKARFRLERIAGERG